jgi:hypothetical protein
VPEQDEADLMSGDPPDDANQTDASAPLDEEAGEDTTFAVIPAEITGDLAADTPEQPSEPADHEEAAEDRVAAGQPVEFVNDISPEASEPQDETDDLEGVTQTEPAESPVKGEPPPLDAVLADQPEPVVPPAPVKETRRLSRAERETYERMRRRFAACGRCGYFLGDLQVYLGEEALQSAGLASRDDWLRLEGDATFRRLLLNAYGVDLDIDYDYFDGACPECRRRFVFIEQADGPTRLKLRL